MRCMKFGLMILGASLLFVVPALADVVTINAITPQWQNVLPGGVTFLSINNAGDPISVRWGDGNGGPQSGYDFNDTTTPFSVDTNVNSGLFNLGLFTHLNNPIFGQAITSVDLSVTLAIAGVGSPFTEVFTFHHDETPNTSTGCCDDIVTFDQGSLNSTFVLSGNAYKLELLGFSNNGGATLLTQFNSTEGGQNSASLYGRITTANVPEPSSLLLLLSGLSGLGFVRYRKQS